MSTERGSGVPTTRRYSPGKKASTVRTRKRARDGPSRRVAARIGNGFESVRMLVKYADVDDRHVGGVNAAEVRRVRALAQEKCELRCANVILK